MNRRIKKKKYKQTLQLHTTKKQRDKNKALCKRYPFLIPRRIWTDEILWMNKPYDCTLAEEFPKGWWKAFGLQFCEELRNELIKHNYLHKFRFEQIKEKFGGLRAYYGSVPIDCNVDVIIDDYSCLSENICEQCGKPDTPMICWRGWYSVVCEDCYDKAERRHRKNNPPIPYTHWEASEPRMMDERKYTSFYRKPLALDIGIWDEYVQIYEEFQDKDLARINNKGEITSFFIEKHVRNLRDKAEKIRARWRANHEERETGCMPEEGQDKGSTAAGEE